MWKSEADLENGGKRRVRKRTFAERGGEIPKRDSLVACEREMESLIWCDVCVSEMGGQIEPPFYVTDSLASSR